jgi:cytochrome c553
VYKRQALAGLVVVLAFAYGWLTWSANRILAQTYEIHEVDFPIPFPLSEAEAAELAEGDEAHEGLALERAIERGAHLVTARYGCMECHGENLGGGVMIDAFPIGTLLGPNLTMGEGSRTLDYGPADWDRIVRHGVLPDGRPAVMPSEDFQWMSDQELSDIVAYIRSLPPVDNEPARPSFGPLGKFLLVRGELKLSYDQIADHDRPHPELPPPAAVSEEFGQHLAGVCIGCHLADFSGGPIIGGDPSWAPARNLTPHPDALGAWDYADFERAMRQGIRPDGSELVEPMTLVMPYAQRMTDTELEALWVYLQTLPPIAPSQ